MSGGDLFSPLLLLDDDSIDFASPTKRINRLSFAMTITDNIEQAQELLEEAYQTEIHNCTYDCFYLDTDSCDPEVCPIYQFISGLRKQADGLLMKD